MYGQSGEGIIKTVSIVFTQQYLLVKYLRQTDLVKADVLFKTHI